MPAALRRTLALLLVSAWASAVAAQTDAAQSDAVADAAQTEAAGESQTEAVGESRGFGDEPIELTADALDYDAEQELYVASGDVVLRQGARTLRADWLAFNRATGVGVASGNVELREGDEILRAESVQFDVDSVEGMVRQGEIDSPAGQFRASGDEIRKTGERSYTFRRGVFTTCRCPKGSERQPWQIRAEEADLDIGGYGTVRDARFEVLGVPVLWLPWMIIPLRTERQSGFLLPELSVGSRRGFEIGIPFFWAVSEDLNATITPYYGLRRGFKGDGLLEYVIGQESSGELFGAFAYDQEVRPNSNNEPFNRERWSTIGVQDLHWPADLRFRSDFRFVSDNDYPLDYPELRERRADRWLQSWASVGRTAGDSGRFVGVGAARFADDMQSPDDVDRDTTALHRLPEVTVAALPGAIEPIPWLRPSFDASFVSYHATDRPDQQDDGFQDTGPDGVFNPREGLPGPGPAEDPHDDDFVRTGGGEGDARFQEGEPLTDDGQRVRLNPRLAAPLALGGAIEVYPEVGWSETLYATRQQAFDRRGLFTGRVDLRTRLRRRFDEVAHAIEPMLGYAYVSPQSQSRNPLLEPATGVVQQRIRSLDLDAVTRDSADRIERANRVTWGALQRLELGGEGDSAVGAELTLLGSYELEQEDFGWIVADGSLEPARYGATRFHVGYDPEKEQLAEALFEWRWRHEIGHQLALGYRYLREIPDVFEEWRRGERFDNFDQFDRIEQAFVEMRVQATPRWLLGYRTAFSFDREVFLQNAGLVEYLSRCGCWAAGVELAMDRASGVDVRLIYRLVGLGDSLADSPLLDALEGL